MRCDSEECQRVTKSVNEENGAIVKMREKVARKRIRKRGVNAGFYWSVLEKIETDNEKRGTRSRV